MRRMTLKQVAEIAGQPARDSEGAAKKDGHSRATPKKPGSGWTVLGSIYDLRLGRSAEAGKYILLIALPREVCAAELGGPRRPGWFDDTFEFARETIAQRVSCAIEQRRIFHDDGTWAEWDAFVLRLLDAKVNPHPRRGEKFDPDVAALELEALDVKVIWSLARPNRMRVVSRLYSVDDEDEKRKKKKKRRRPSPEDDGDDRGEEGARSRWPGSEDEE